MRQDQIIRYALATEKSMRLMESENKLAFIVDKRANKQEIKKAIEEEFSVKIQNVSTTITPNGKKKAYIQFTEETPAIDVATKLGLM